MKKDKTDKNVQENNEQTENLTEEVINNEDSSTLENQGDTEQESGISEVEKLQKELSESKDKYLRLYSEFENYRRRTAREKLELIDTATEGLMTALLPVIDDFERAENSLNDESANLETVREGLDLIFQKFKNTLTQKGLKNMENVIGGDFDPDFHEAITQIPVEDKKKKGKVVDVIEKGYMLKDKVIRYAKVVTGA